VVQGLEQLNRADVVGGDYSGRPGGTLYLLRDDSCPKQLAMWPGMILICDARQLRPWLGRLSTLRCKWRRRLTTDTNRLTSGVADVDRTLRRPRQHMD